MGKLTRILAVLFAFALLAAACGDDDDTSADDDDTTADDTTDDDTTDDDTTDDDTTDDDDMADDDDMGDGVAAAQAVVDANVTAPTDIGPTIPLESTPDTKTVAWLECELPSCTDITPGWVAATDLIGWDLEIVGTQSFDPAGGFQQAIDLGVDYIALTGTPASSVQDQIDAAAEAGIAFFSCFDTAEPLQEENNIWAQCSGNDDVFGTGSLIANAIVADSGGTANVLMVNIPDFAVLVSEREGSEAVYAEKCPDCTFNELAVTIDQLLAGDVPGAVLSALQADPDIDYVHFAFDGLTGGVSTTLEEAGLLDGVNLVGVDFSAAVLQEIVDGTHQFWTANPKEYSAWLLVDAMARHAIGQENTEERANADIPNFIVNSPEVAEPLIATNGWPGPETMAEQFGALWGVAG